MGYYSKPKDISALEAKLEAQKIAFSPIAFQAVMTLLRTGVLELISEAGEQFRLYRQCRYQKEKDRLGKRSSE